MTRAARCAKLRVFKLLREVRMNASNARRQLLALILAPALAPAQAQTVIGSGRAAEQNRDVAAFAAIVLRGGIDLVVTQGERESLQVQADDNLLPLLQTVVEVREAMPTLVVQWASGSSVRPRTRTRVAVQAMRLERLLSQGSGHVAVGALKAPALALSLSGSSDARIDALDSALLDVAIAGSGNALLAGRVERLGISITGSGDVSAFELAAGAVTVSIAGSGDARVHADKTLAVRIAGSGDVEYRGGATLTDSRIRGSGTVRRRP
jgi:hypothetical protein